jgi:hypothetical protein
MIPRRSRPRSDLPVLWAEYKELIARWLPVSPARLVRSRRFDRLLLAYALYSCLVLGITALGLVLGSDLLGQVLGWPTPTDPGVAPTGASSAPSPWPA